MLADKVNKLTGVVETLIGTLRGEKEEAITGRVQQELEQDLPDDDAGIEAAKTQDICLATGRDDSQSDRHSPSIRERELLEMNHILVKRIDVMLHSGWLTVEDASLAGRDDMD